MYFFKNRRNPGKYTLKTVDLGEIITVITILYVVHKIYLHAYMLHVMLLTFSFLGNPVLLVPEYARSNYS